MATQQAKNFVSLLSVKMTQCNLFVVREGCNLVILAGSHLGAFFASFRFRSDYAFANRIREILHTIIQSLWNSAAVDYAKKIGKI